MNYEQAVKALNSKQKVEYKGSNISMSNATFEKINAVIFRVKNDNTKLLQVELQSMTSNSIVVCEAKDVEVAV